MSSKLSRAVRGALNPVLGLLGLRLESARKVRELAAVPVAEQPTLRGGLRRLAARGLGAQTLVDVGAAEGTWARTYARALGPPGHLLLVEAQPVHRAALEAFRREFPSAHVVHAAAGAEVGETWFEASTPLGGTVAEEPTGAGSWIRVPVTTLDREVTSRRLPGPYLLKLDTHGYELPILSGARAVLAETVGLVVECYNFDLTPTTRRFPEFCRSMEALGFRCVDAWDLMFRPRDGALWQMDLLFVRADRPEFTAPGATRYETPSA